MSIFICIDLKSFYASVECVERGLNPLTTNLVVADSSRTEKTICLAVSPSLKQYGIPGRARLFEVVQKIKDINMVPQILQMLGQEGLKALIEGLQQVNSEEEAIALYDGIMDQVSKTMKAKLGGILNYINKLNTIR